ncbi:hypothetical protein P153DRAFT_280325 [Dothidotthia symphoricarpi CBS 119687]|uniref:L domain-like protein n=1 Tax=Dothidotthia symphoricarpi CBS 119687 TaxID=1392245 RepID=A0A6A6AQ88_9PLEO|nr:uncharacterized protein P153DRAFT_280325 [Dothidotthia symphoricarpi CBS 119687]KAF2134089.1 hypothetical protein P153DRAFT_280325 [Dothidotthia symphoricarpi CBS 119687]
MDSDAILPSSPPRASAPNLPSSPFFEPRDHAFSPKSSSPPPLFSSDDSRESADVGNYVSPRIFKNKRKGAWWESENGDSAQNTPEAKKVKMTRNFDSGVFMMSDASDGSVDLLPEHKSPFDLPGAWDEPPSMGRGENVFYPRMRMGLDKNSDTYEFEGLGLGDDDIHYIGELDSVIRVPPVPGDDLPTEGQFRSMIPELHINLSNNNLCRLTPTLFHVRFLTSLSLRNNQIVELPPQINQLRHLEMIDLSLNKLVSLPFELLGMFRPYGNLEDVRTLGNHTLLERESSTRFYVDLYEDLSLSSLGTRTIQTLHRMADEKLPGLYASLSSSPDRERDVWKIRELESWTSMVEPTQVDETLETVGEGVYPHHPPSKYQSIKLNKDFQRDLFSPTYYARTPVSYFDQAGVLIKGSPSQPTSNDHDFCAIVETTRGAYDVPPTWFSPPRTSRVSSLVATCLHNVLRKRHLDSLSIDDVRALIPEPVPVDADRILAQAAENSIAGYSEFRHCHVCKHEYVVARAEWIEFWKVSAFYPLKVKVCSWACVPAEMRERPRELMLE